MNAILSADEVGDYFTGFDPEVHAALWRSAESLVRDICHRNFVADTFTEYPKSANGFLYVREPPIRSVTSLTVQSNQHLLVSDTRPGARDHDYILMDAGTEHSRIDLHGPGVRFNAGDIELIYAGGYVDIPEEVRLGVGMAMRNIQAQREAGGATRFSAGGENYDYGADPYRALRGLLSMWVIPIIR